MRSGTQLRTLQNPRSEATLARAHSHVRSPWPDRDQSCSTHEAQATLARAHTLTLLCSALAFEQTQPPTSSHAMLSSALSFFWTGIESVRASSVPRGDYAQWIACSFVAHWILFFILPASPWLPKEGGEQRAQSADPSSLTV